MEMENMKGILEEKLKKTDYKKWFRKDNLVILILTGVLLVIIALPTKDSGKEEAETPWTEENSPAGIPSESGAEAVGAADSDEEYIRQLEQRLRETLSRMEGVGKVRVMITLSSSRELVVEKEQPYLRSSTDEKDSQGGNRSVHQMETEENTVYRTDGSVSEPYVIKTLPPQVEGVVVVAEGAGSGTVDRTIVEMVQALFGVEAHKVKVVKMEKAE